MNMSYMDLSIDDVVHLPRVNASPLWAPQIEINKEILDSTERVFIVSSSHLDLGFADTLVNIVSKYFDNYFPKAIEIAEELRQYNHKEHLLKTSYLSTNKKPTLGFME